MKSRHYLIIALMPVLQVAYGGYTAFWVVPSFPEPVAPRALDGFIATQPTHLASTGWLVASSNEMKRYDHVYEGSRSFAQSQSTIIFLSGLTQMLLILVAVALFQASKHKELNKTPETTGS
jgi:hypothetical protein